MTEILVLGVGNTMWADEGVGPAIIERLNLLSEWQDVDVMDGGTQGLYLLPHIQSTQRLLIFDAVDFKRPPGSILVLRDDEIPIYYRQRPLSLHETTFTDVLAAADLTGEAPTHITLIGIQYAVIDIWCGTLSEVVEAAIPEAIKHGKKEIDSWKMRLN